MTATGAQAAREPFDSCCFARSAKVLSGSELALASMGKEASARGWAGLSVFVQSRQVVAAPAGSHSATIASVSRRRRARAGLPSRSLVRGRGVVFAVGDVVAPGRGVAVVVDPRAWRVGHEAIGGGAVPVGGTWRCAKQVLHAHGLIQKPGSDGSRTDGVHGRGARH